MEQPMTTILCVDDDPYLTDLLCYGFEREGFAVVTAHTGREGVRRAHTESVDLVLLDVSLPDIDGFTVLAALRSRQRVLAVPVIMLTARHLEQDVISGLERGADDYVTKPFSMQVLVTRVKAVLRRATTPPVEAVAAAVEDTAQHTYQVAGARLDADAHALTTPEGAQVWLTPTESRILQLLATHTGHVLSSERIIESIGGYTRDSDVNVIKTHIRHLREKLAQLPGSPQPIRTQPGAGYVLSSSGRL